MTKEREKERSSQLIYSYMSDVHDDDQEDDNSDLDECDDDGNMRVDEPPQANRPWQGPGLGRGGESTGIFGSNLAGRKTAALSFGGIRQFLFAHESPGIYGTMGKASCKAATCPRRSNSWKERRRSRRMNFAVSNYFELNSSCC
jgi:hypothetical protein